MTDSTQPHRLGGYTAAADATVQPESWGRLEWMVSGELRNSEVLTVGKCFINPGMENPAHFHPNCDEVLHVIRGRIRHRLGQDYVEMGPGDTISIPQGTVHNARSLDQDEAEFLIVFSTPAREVVGE